MDVITVGVLTVSDSCASGDAVDESGPALVQLIQEGLLGNAAVVRTSLVPDSTDDIQRLLVAWSDQDICLLLTTGGTGLSPRDVTPEATAAVSHRTVPGIPLLALHRCSAATPLAALSRATAGVRGRTLIVNLPGSRRAAKECLQAVAGVLPHAVDVLRGRKTHVERVHAGLRKKSSVDRHAPGSRAPEYPMVSVEEGQDMMMKKVVLLRGEEVVGLKEAVSHVLMQDVMAKDDLPPFDVSLMDGYAIARRGEVKKLIGTFEIGEYPPDTRVEDNTCVRVSTGGPIPRGTQEVVPVEYTSLSRSLTAEGVEESFVRMERYTRSRNIREKGSDYERRKKLVDSETLVSPIVAGILAASGNHSVRVFRKPKVAVLSTGNELVDGETAEGGKVRDCNRMTLLSFLREERFEAVDLGICPDEPDCLRDALEKGFRAADVVVTTGSMSMGERDYLKRVIIEDFGGEICFGRVCMKPGKPTAFGVVSFEGPKLWFGFPGNPASAVVASHFFLLPALRKISNRKRIFPRKIKAFVGSRPEKIDRPQYISCVATFSREINGFSVGDLSSQRSSWIGSFVDGNCLAEIPNLSVTEDSPEYITAYLFGEPIID